jgi:acyl-CoA dehydrogenase
MNDIKEMIADSINRIFDQSVDRRLLDAAEGGAWAEDLWRTVEESGFTNVLELESADDFEGKCSNAYPIFHAIGYHRAPLPLSETVIANGLLSLAGLAPVDGPATIIQQMPGDGLVLELKKGCLVLNGTALAVPWARVARVILVTGSYADRQVMGLIDTAAAGVKITPGLNLAKEPRDTVVFEASVCRAFTECPSTMPETPVLLYGALARAAMMTGAAESILRDSVQYANDRVQFGRPIGKFQAIQQALAVLAGEVTSAKMAVVAACDASKLVPRSFEVAVAKIRCGQAAGISAGIAHQVHGAIGFTHEHTLHYATRRLWSWRTDFGAENVWARQLGSHAIRRCGRAFWTDLTASQLA